MPAHVSSHPQPPRRPRQRGASLVEFVVVGPLITLLGMALIHYGHFFFTKNHLDNAAFMAVRAGSTDPGELATSPFLYRPQSPDSIEATTILTQRE